MHREKTLFFLRNSRTSFDNIQAGHDLQMIRVKKFESFLNNLVLLSIDGSSIRRTYKLTSNSTDLWANHLLLLFPLKIFNAKRKLATLTIPSSTTKKFKLS